MFHMGDDVKILAVAAGSATAAVGAALLLARSISRSIAPASARPPPQLAAGDLAARAPDRRRRARSPQLATLVQRDGGEHREPLRRAARARRLGEPRPAHAARVDAGDARGDRGRPRRARTSTCRRCASRCATLAVLVDDLFELARIDAGALTLELRQTRRRRARRRRRLGCFEAEAAAPRASACRRAPTGEATVAGGARQGRARALQPAHERPPAHAVRRRGGGRRRRGAGSRCASRSRTPARASSRSAASACSTASGAPTAHASGSAGTGSGSRSRAASSRPTAAGSGPRTATAAPACHSRCPDGPRPLAHAAG